MSGESHFRSLNLFASILPQTLSPRWAPSVQAVAEKPHLGIKSGQLLNLLPHLFSFLHSEPAPEGAKTRWGLGLREAKGAGGG